jgi:hypothetical protein
MTNVAKRSEEEVKWSVVKEEWSDKEKLKEILMKFY